MNIKRSVWIVAKNSKAKSGNNDLTAQLNR
jgi:hypothetical protein